ncbi:hypothetical protein ACHAXA_011716 [Cyclostephanos tholiformis]|uniref:Uncharacterized protein n=1 Tax=Cyclostephanos tholiformis TaxID=382380 RepID=A0ABD3RZF8_9STRA
MQPAEKEPLNESLYKKRVQSILHKHKRLLLAAYESSPPDAIEGSEDQAQIKIKYASERAIIDRVIANERSAFLCGLALSGFTFASLRFGPRYLISKMNPEKLKKLDDADAISFNAKSRWIQKSVAFIFEAAFSGLVGWRVGYSKVSSQNANSYEEIAKIPLCSGRSSISDKACPDLVDLVHNEMPPLFWENLDNKKENRLQDPQRWQAIRTFADNCIRRKMFEEYYRKQNGLNPQAVVDIPRGGVPNHTVQTFKENASA